MKKAIRTAGQLLAAILLLTNPALAHHVMGGRMPVTFTDGLLSGLGHPVIGIERVDPAKRKLHPSTRRWQAAPGAEMRASDGDLQHHALGCHVPVLHLDRQIG